MLIKNYRLNTMFFSGDEIRVDFDIHYSDGEVVVGDVTYNKDGEIVNHCNPSLKMGRKNETNYYIEFGEVCKILQGFEGVDAKSLFDKVNKVLSDYKSMAKDLKVKHNFKEIDIKLDEVRYEIDTTIKTLKRLKNEDKIKDAIVKLNSLNDEFKDLNTSINTYFNELTVLEEEEALALKNIVVIL